MAVFVIFRLLFFFFQLTLVLISNFFFRPETDQLLTFYDEVDHLAGFSWARAVWVHLQALDVINDRVDFCRIFFIVSAV